MFPLRYNTYCNTWYIMGEKNQTIEEKNKSDNSHFAILILK